MLVCLLAAPLRSAAGDDRLNFLLFPDVTASHRAGLDAGSDLSRDAYERLLLTRTMHGTGVPDSYDSEARLARALQANRAAITYMWEDEAVKPGFKIIARLWQASE